MKPSGPETLTRREQEVLQLIAEGLTTKHIADLLGISVKTAITHRTHLMQKLGLHNVAQVTRYALQQQEQDRNSERERKMYEEMRAARELYRVAAEENKRLIEIARATGWNVNADGSQALYRAGMVEREAIEKYAEALKSFAALVLERRRSSGKADS